MSATERVGLPESSVDLSRLSVVTSTPGPSTPDETGSVYRADTLAAGRLVHTMPVDSVHFLALFSSSWTSGVFDQANPGVVTSKAVDSSPGAFWVDTSGESIAVELPSTPETLIGASSFGNLLHVLGTKDENPALFSYRISQYGSAGGLDFIGDEWLPPSRLSSVVSWDRGIYQSGRYLYVVGADTNNRLFLRKRMLTTIKDAPLFLGHKGWTASQLEMDPIRDHRGFAVVSTGPVSLARYGTEWFMATSARQSTDTVVSFWRAAHPRSGFHRLPATVNLGADPDSTTAYLQESVHPNPDHIALSETDAVTGIPFVYTVESPDSLRTSWGLVGVPRVRL